MNNNMNGMPPPNQMQGFGSFGANAPISPPMNLNPVQPIPTNINPMQMMRKMQRQGSFRNPINNNMNNYGMNNFAMNAPINLNPMQNNNMNGMPPPPPPSGQNGANYQYDQALQPRKRK